MLEMTPLVPPFKGFSTSLISAIKSVVRVCFVQFMCVMMQHITSLGSEFLFKLGLYCLSPAGLLGWISVVFSEGQ